MLTVHVEPTEDSFFLDLMFRTVNINQFGAWKNIMQITKYQHVL